MIKISFLGWRRIENILAAKSLSNLCGMLVTYLPHYRHPNELEDGIRVSGKLGQVQLTFFVKCSYAELIEGNMKLFVRLAKSLLLDISNATTASSFVSICNPSHCWCGRGTWRYFWKIRLICLFLDESLVKRQVLIFYLKKHINLKMMQ